MPLTASQNHQLTHLRVENGRAGALRFLRDTQHHAHEFRARQKKVEGSTNQLNQLHTLYTHFANLHPMELTRLGAVAILTLAAYVLDLALYRPVAQYFGGADLPLSLKWLFTFTLPLAILFLELGICAHRTRHHELYAHGLEGSGPLILWRFFSLVMTIVIPAAVIGTFLASSEDLSTNVRYIILASLSALAVVSHAAIIWGGDLAIEAKSLISYRFWSWWLQRSIDGEQGPLNGAQQATRDAFTSFIHARDDFNAEHPDRKIGPPLIDDLTVQVLREIYGREVIQMPSASEGSTSGPPSSPESPQSPNSPVSLPDSGANEEQQNGRTPGSADVPPQTQPSSGNGKNQEDGELDYLRTVLSRRVREADGEVKT